MAKRFDKETLKKLAKEFKVSPEICEQYSHFYEKKILSRIQKKYLADLVSVVEDMINEKIKSTIRKDQSKKGIGTPELRRYNIILSDKPPKKNGKSHTWKLSRGAIITYDSGNSKKDICFSIAHELGNLLVEHGIITNAGTENHADLFAHFASGIEQPLDFP